MAGLSYWYRPSSGERYLYKTITELLEEQCQRSPGKEAYIFYDEELQRTSITFREASEQSLNLAAGLLKTYPDLQPGCRICIYTDSKWEYLLSVVAALRLGLVATLANIDEHKGDKLIQAIDQTQCQGIIADLSCMEKHGTAEILAKRENWIFTILNEEKSTTNGSLCLGHLLDVGDNCEQTRSAVLRRQATIQPDNGALVLLSSGTSGLPKAALVSHARLINMISLFHCEVSFGQEDIHVHNGPFSHGSGFGYGFCFPTFFGSSTVSVAKKLKIPSAESSSYLSVIERENCTTALLFGFVIYDLTQGIRNEKLDLSTLRSVVTGGQILSEKSAEQLLLRFPNLNIIQIYSLTEAYVATNSMKKNLLWMRIFENTEVKLIDRCGQVVPMNSPGEICVRSNTTMTGYIIDGKVHSGKDEEGWFHTDDSGIMNDSGELFIIGRMSDIIIRGPSNVQVRPFEEILDGHPKVKKSAIVPVPDPRLVYDLCICIVPSDPAVTEMEVLDWCSLKFGEDRNGINLRPKLCIILDEFPQTSTGKISKTKLKELALRVSEVSKEWV